MESSNFRASKGFVRASERHISALAVNKAEDAVNDHLLTEPVMPVGNEHQDAACEE
jgi:hypothetical protein